MRGTSGAARTESRAMGTTRSSHFGMPFERISVDPGPWVGCPASGAPGSPAATVVGMVAHNMTTEEILATFPISRPRTSTEPCLRRDRRRRTRAAPVLHIVSFPVDASLSDRVPALLCVADHDAVHVEDRGLFGAEDTQVTGGCSG